MAGTVLTTGDETVLTTGDEIVLTTGEIEVTAGTASPSSRVRSTVARAVRAATAIIEAPTATTTGTRDRVGGGAGGGIDIFATVGEQEDSHLRIDDDRRGYVAAIGDSRSPIEQVAVPRSSDTAPEDDRPSLRTETSDGWTPSLIVT